MEKDILAELSTLLDTPPVAIRAGTAVRTLTLQVAVKEEGFALIAEALGALLYDCGVDDPESAILDWQYHPDLCPIKTHLDRGHSFIVGQDMTPGEVFERTPMPALTWQELPDAGASYTHFDKFTMFVNEHPGPRWSVGIFVDTTCLISKFAPTKQAAQAGVNSLLLHYLTSIYTKIDENSL